MGPFASPVCGEETGASQCLDESLKFSKRGRGPKTETVQSNPFEKTLPMSLKNIGGGDPRWRAFWQLPRKDTPEFAENCWRWGTQATAHRFKSTMPLDAGPRAQLSCALRSQSTAANRATLNEAAVACPNRFLSHRSVPNASLCTAWAADTAHAGLDYGHARRVVQADSYVRRPLDPWKSRCQIAISGPRTPLSLRCSSRPDWMLRRR